MNGVTLKLTPLRTPISNGALAAEQLPDRLKIMAWGDNPSVKGRVSLTAVSASTLPARQASLGFDRIALDYEHNTVEGTPENVRTKEPREVAAYGVPVLVPNDGLYLERLEWTPSGKVNALNFADLSPAVELDKNGNIIFVHSCALCRNGAVEGLSFYNVTLPSETKTSTPENHMPELTLEVLSAELAKAMKPLTDRIAALEAVKPAAVDLTPLTARLDKIEAGATAAATAAIEAEKATLIPLFAAEGRSPINPVTGKAYTADELKALDVPTLKVLHANSPKTVPLSARARTGVEGGGTTNLKGLARAIAAHTAGN